MLHQTKSPSDGLGFGQDVHRKPVAGNRDTLSSCEMSLYVRLLPLKNYANPLTLCCIKRAFYKAINGILSYCKTADEFVKLGLVKAYCLPLLTYCIGAIDLPASSVKDLAVCWYCMSPSSGKPGDRELVQR